MSEKITFNDVSQPAEPRYSPMPNFFVSMEFQLIGFLSFKNVLHILVKWRFLIEVKNALSSCSKRHKFFAHDPANDFF